MRSVLPIMLTFFVLFAVCSVSFAQRICGKRPIEMDHQRDSFQPFVVGGTEENSWPWMVSIYYENSRGNYSFICVGSVITPTHVLSAAHCYTEGVKFVVRWGTTNMSSPVTLEDEGVLEVLRVHIPQEYRSRKHYFDIAIISVKGRMDATPVCLPQPQQIFERKLNVTLTGWGHTEHKGNVSFGVQEAELQMVDQAICKELYSIDRSRSLDRGIADSMICAYAEGKDACKSDSGSPLVTLVEDGRWVQIGVASFGYPCADPNYPAVYSRVTSYADWIRRTIRRSSRTVAD